MTAAGSGSDFRESHLRGGDFTGAFAVVRRGERILMVRNERRIAGRITDTWDLPGGQVEPGELLAEALSRELREETGLRSAGVPRFLFVQEGVKTEAGRRLYRWLSFFFAVGAVHGEPQAGGEVRELRWVAPDEMHALLRAPYHDSFRTWLERGGSWFESRWDE